MSDKQAKFVDEEIIRQMQIVNAENNIGDTDEDLKNWAIYYWEAVHGSEVNHV